MDRNNNSAPLRYPRFICDVHIGTFSGYLRISGFEWKGSHLIKMNKIF
jgi:uncharacterized protein with PIN domain